MAELILKVGDSSTYSDGDILCAFNNRRTKCCHAQMICHYQHAGFTNDGLRPAGLSLDALDCCYQYRFERLNATQVKRIETDYLGNVLAEEVFGPESMNVELYLRRRKRHAKHRIFGTPGAEIWHGGRSDFSQAATDKMWERIEHHTARRKVDAEYDYFPLGRLDVRHHLPVPTEDFTDEEAELSVAQQVEVDQDGNPVLYDEDGNVAAEGEPKVLAKRNLNVDWVNELLDDLGVTEADVRNHRKVVDRRREMPDQSQRSKIHDRTRGGRVPERGPQA